MVEKEDLFHVASTDGELFVIDNGETLTINGYSAGDVGGADLTRDQVRELRDALTGWLGDENPRQRIIGVRCPSGHVRRNSALAIAFGKETCDECGAPITDFEL